MEASKIRQLHLGEGGRVKRDSIEELQRHVSGHKAALQAKEILNAWRPKVVKSKEFDVTKSGMQICLEEKTV